MEDKKFPKLRIISTSKVPTGKYIQVFLDEVDISNYVREINLHIAVGEVTTAKLSVIAPCDVIDLPVELTGDIRMHEDKQWH
jgi:hypothetical protein